MPTLRSNVVIAIATAGMALAGCQHEAAPATTAGGTAFQFLTEDAPAPVGKPQPAAELVPVDVLVPPEPLGTLAPPRYPKSALGHVVVPATLNLRLVISAEGQVTDFEPSRRGVNVPGPLDADFRAAIAATVAGWHFLPAERRHLVPAKRGGREMWLVTRTEKVEGTLDVAFTFSASGSVVSSLGK